MQGLSGPRVYCKESLSRRPRPVGSWNYGTVKVGVVGRARTAGSEGEAEAELDQAGDAGQEAAAAVYYR